MKKNRVYGQELILNLFDCDLKTISSRKKIAEFADILCKKIRMKKYGKALIPYFGVEKPHTKGYSLVQLIETSSITGHFSEHWKTAYINIFSCKTFDPKIAKDFTKKFFGAKRVKARFIIR